MIHRLRPLIEFHIPRFSNSESSRQFIVRITLGKSGALFVQKGIRPHLTIISAKKRDNVGGTNEGGYFIDWTTRSPGLPFDGDLGDLGDLGAVVRGDLGVPGPALSVGIESSIASLESGAAGGSFLSPPSCRITGCTYVGATLCLHHEHRPTFQGYVLRQTG